MKKIIILVLISFSGLSQAQNLSFDQVINLRKQNLATVEEYLTSKNWSFLDGTEPTYERLGNATFTYKRSMYDDKAECFFKYMYSQNSDRKRISVQLVKKDIYNTYLARIKSLGCKLIKSEIVDGSLEKTYQGATTTIRISISTNKEDFYSSKTIYYFFILDNEDYFINYVSDSLYEVAPAPADTIAIGY